MPKRTIALITIIAIIAILLVIAAFIQLTKDTPEGTSTVNTTPPQQNIDGDIKRASLSFNPSTASASFTPSRVEIVADTGGLEVTGVQLELEYDPTKLSNVQIFPVTANNLFGTGSQVLIQELRPEVGRISYAVVINPTADEVKGIGSIIGLSFSAVPGASGETEIKFLEKSLVTIFGTTESALKGTVPLTVTLNSATGSGQVTQPFIQPSPTAIPIQ